jgi:tetratricopeptide (TPR) repeat protein
MAETAKILRFPARAAGSFSSSCRESASTRASAFLELPRDDRSIEVTNSTLRDGDVLMSLCLILWNSMNTSPSNVSIEASQLYNWVSSRTNKEFFFDERDFFLGEAALLAAGSFRLLGRREETERWLDRADAGFRHTVAPAAHLARVSYIRLTLRYDMRRHEDVLELMPSVALTFEKLGMENDLSKCRFLEAMSLKELGRVDEAKSQFESLISGERGRVEPALRGLALLNLGDLHSQRAAFEAALTSYAQALPLLQSANRFASVADVKLMVATTLRSMGKLVPSLEAYRDAARDHEALGMATRVAYIRILLAEALLEAGRPREAEWEILAALPTIDEEEMVPEGAAAVALLQESVRQRKTDPKALLQLREYLQAKN